MWPVAGGSILMLLMVAIIIGGKRTIGRSSTTSATESKLLGVWAFANSNREDIGTIEFMTGGKLRMAALVPRSGWLNVEGTYMVEGNSLAVMLRADGNEKMKKLTIQTLNGTTLVTRDSNGRVDEFRRVSPRIP
jgi:uncharacterized protein (TIGR03066 family)